MSFLALRETSNMRIHAPGCTRCLNGNVGARIFQAPSAGFFRHSRCPFLSVPGFFRHRRCPVCRCQDSSVTDFVGAWSQLFSIKGQVCIGFEHSSSCPMTVTVLTRLQVLPVSVCTCNSLKCHGAIEPLVTLQCKSGKGLQRFL